MKKQETLIGVAGTFQTFISENNIDLIPTSATITIYSPNSSAELVSAQAMTIGSDGLLSYALTAENNELIDENYQADITYVLNGNTEFLAPVFYDVVNSILTSVITDDDVVKELPQITEKGYKEFGTATSGSTTTIVNGDLQRFTDGYWTGGLAESLTQGEKREITGFVQSTGAVTTEAFTATAATDKYMLTRSYTREIDRALDKIRDRIQQKGQYHALILDSADLKEVHLMFTVAEICKSFVVSVDDVWDMFRKDYQEKADEMFRNFKFKYDEDEDGFIGSGEEDDDYTGLRSGRA